MPDNLHIQATELKTLLASTAARQNALAGLPPAMKALPVVALGFADYVKRRYGWGYLDRLLPEGNGDGILVGPPKSQTKLPPLSGFQGLRRRRRVARQEAQAQAETEVKVVAERRDGKVDSGRDARPGKG